jgi:hypothetical protein
MANNKRSNFGQSLQGASQAAELAGQSSLSREFALKIKDEGGVIASRP